MELLDVVDENNNMTDQINNRKIVHDQGLWHREICIIVKNKENQLLIQKRSDSKKLAPNMWSLTAGHIEAGEEPVSAALRETSEELGINNLKLEDFQLMMIQKSENISGEIKNNHFKYIFLLETDYRIQDFILQPSEVKEVKYVSIQDLKSVCENYEKYKNEYTKSIFKEFFIKILDDLTNNSTISNKNTID